MYMTVYVRKKFKFGSKFLIYINSFERINYYKKNTQGKRLQLHILQFNIGRRYFDIVTRANTHLDFTRKTF